MELLWQVCNLTSPEVSHQRLIHLQFLMKRQELDVARRLRAQIYRMARKSAYLPHTLQIGHPSITNKRSLAGGANARVTKATMNSRDVVIKEISCSDPAAKRKCLEVWNFLNRFLSSQTKI